MALGISWAELKSKMDELRDFLALNLHKAIHNFFTR